MMESRLDRLLLLISSNSTPVDVKNNAVLQLSLLNDWNTTTKRVMELIKSQSYDTRQSVVEYFQLMLKSGSNPNPNLNPTASTTEYLTTDDVPLNLIISSNSYLYSTDDKRYSTEELNINTQKRELLKELSGGGGGSAGGGIESIITDDDLIGNVEVVEEEVEEDYRIQKKRRIESSNSSRVFPIRIITTSYNTFKDYIHSSTSTDEVWNPFTTIKNLLFHSDWEVRHTCSCIIKEYLLLSTTTTTTNTAELEDLFVRLFSCLLLDRFSDFDLDSRVMPVRESVCQCISILVNSLYFSSSSSSSSSTNNKKKEDGILLQKIIKEYILQLVESKDLLLLLLSSQIADGRVLLLLLLKYLFLLDRQFVYTFLLCNVELQEFILQSFDSQDGDEDVLSLACQCMIPILSLSSEEQEQEQENVWDAVDLQRIAKCLVLELKNMDDLSSCVGSVLDLLSLMVDYVSFSNEDGMDSAAAAAVVVVVLLLESLLLYFRHNVQSVRKSVLKCIQKILTKGTDNNHPPLLSSALLDHVMMNLVLETDTVIIAETMALVQQLVSLQQSTLINSIIFNNLWLEKWCQCVANPLYTRMNLSLFPLQSVDNAMDKAVLEFDQSVVSFDSLLENRYNAMKVLGMLCSSCSFSLNFSDRVVNICKLLNTTNMWFHLFLLSAYIEGLNQNGKFEIKDELEELLVSILYEKRSMDSVYTYAEVSPNVFQGLDNNQSVSKQLQNNEEFMQCDQRALGSVVVAMIASECVIPKQPQEQQQGGGGEQRKMNPILRNLVNSVKFESIEFLQKRNAKYLALLLQQLLTQSSYEKVAVKCLGNLSVLICNSHQMNENTFRGVQFAFQSLCELFGNELFSRFPSLMEEQCQLATGEYAKLKSCVLTATEIVKTVEVSLLLKNFLCEPYMESIGRILFNYQEESMTLIVCDLITEMAKRVEENRSEFEGYSTTSKLSHPLVYLITQWLGLLDDPRAEKRLPVVTCLHVLLSKLGMLILPYLVLLVGPCLGRLHDLDAKVRLLANQAFGLMMVYLPLESKLYKNNEQNEDSEEDKDPFLSKQLIAERKSKRKFIVQLLDPSKIETFHLPVRINAELRSYQQDGINWLYFLNQYKLHGVLCDDMGLGKTLQTICIMSSDHYLNRQKFRIPSLVICPNSVTGHWKHEIEKYTHPSVEGKQEGYFPMQPLLYMGPSAVRNQLRKSFSYYDVIVTSYETVRSDIDFLTSMHFNYCVLDEGHIIKNPTTKITLAVKSLRSNHRLILSGTPVNNNVLELWSLFDFLMPGFLGTEKEFDQKYSKHIQAMKGVKMKTSKQKVSASDSKRIVEKGSLALEQLHKQVLPFLLRRLKEQVLNDLPPKIIQDYYCEMSTVQSIIYKEFLKEEAQSLTKDTSDDAKKKSSHIFGALVYLRKLCNHPALVYDDCAEDIQQMINRELMFSSSQIDDLKHGPKLLALQELLLECGIKPSASENDIDYSAGRHRILIFCQMKTMLDMIELLLFKKHMPHVTYLRMDGSTPSQKRQEICVNFNSDPTIDVLLLTTQVGGLGLNLTGADTVIFVEHDWNPQKDMQAMDRAHRLGQKRVVNVYRLITRDTLEEKIMGLQQFKLNIANTVVNQENTVGLSGMGGDQIIDLFNTNEPETDKKKQKEKSTPGIPGSIAGISTTVLEELNSLSNNSAEEYEKEFDVQKFMQKLHSK